MTTIDNHKRCRMIVRPGDTAQWRTAGCPRSSARERGFRAPHGSRAAHRNADSCLRQGGCIIDAVGLSGRIIAKRPGPAEHSKAIGPQCRLPEVTASLGVGGAVVAQAGESDERGSLETVFFSAHHSARGTMRPQNLSGAQSTS